jgi:putative membrane protein
VDIGLAFLVAGSSGHIGDAAANRPPEKGECKMMGPYGYGGGWMALGWLTMLVFWALVIVGIVAVIRWAGARNVPSPRGPGDTALEILKRRYASGEITKEQYEEMKRDIA